MLSPKLTRPLLCLSVLALGGCVSDVSELSDQPMDAGADLSDANEADAHAADALAQDAPAPDAAVADVGARGLASRLVLCAELGFPQIVSAVPSPDATKIALATRAKQVVLVSSADGSVVRRIDAHAGQVYSVAFSPDGRTLYSYGDDGWVRAWNTADGSARWSTARTGVPGNDRLAASADLLVLAGRQVELFDPASGDARGSTTDPAIDGRIVVAPAVAAISPDGSRFAAAWGATAVLFDRDGRSTGQTFSGDLGTVEAGAYSPEIQSLEFSPDGDALLVGVRRAYFSSSAPRFPVARIYRLSDGAALATMTGASSYAVTASFSHDGAHVAVTANGPVEWWTVRDANGWLTELPPPLRTAAIATEVRVDQSERLVVHARGLALGVVDPDEGEIFLAPAGDQDGRTLALSSDGTALLRSTADVGSNRSLELWRIERQPRGGTVVIEGPETFEAPSAAADLSLDARWLALAGTAGIELRSLVAEVPSRTLTAELGPIRAVAFAPDQRSLLLASGPAQGARASTLRRVALDGAILDTAEAVGTVGHIRRVAQGWLTLGPSRDSFGGAQGVELWSAEPTLTSLFQRSVETLGPDSADLSADGLTLLIAPWLAPLAAIRFPEGADLSLEPEVRTERVAYAPDGSFLVRAESGGRLVVASPDHPTAGEELAPHGAPYGLHEIERLVFAGDGSRLAISTRAGATRLYCAE